VPVNINKKTKVTGLIFNVFAGIVFLFFACEKLEIERVIKIKTGSVSVITSNSAVITGEITDVSESEIIEHGHCWSTSGNPTINLDAKTELGKKNSKGKFQGQLSELIPNTKYYVKAYATNSQGTVYGNPITFTTLADIVPPVVTTAAITSFTATTAVGGGEVRSNGGATVTARGVCWSTSQNPTIANSKTNDGAGTGIFTSNLTPLTPNTTYYVKAYATNSQVTAYGTQVSLTTLTTGTNNLPVITSTPPTSVDEDVFYTYTLTATDPDPGDVLTYSAVGPPSWLSFNPLTHILSGTPTNSNVGPHNVTLQVSDGKANTDQPFVITVTNVNDKPVITSTPPLSVMEANSYSYQITATDEDAGDILTYSAVVQPSWLSFNTSTHVLSGIPTNSNVGNHNVTLHVSDGKVTVEQKFIITVTNLNQDPVITSDPPVSATEDIAYSYQITATDDDAGDVLTYSAVVRPSWLLFNTSTHVLSGTPTNSNVGSHNVTLRVSDGIANTDQPFVITVANVNDAPVITSSAITNAYVGGAYAYQVIATDIDIADVLTYAAATKPSWLSFSPSTHILSGIPAYEDIGSTNVTLRVTDIGGLYNEQTFSLTVKVETGSVYDSRDGGRTYKTVRIGNQWWMSENLTYLPAVSPSSVGSSTSLYYYVYGYEGTSVSAAKLTPNYITYGVLYNWPAAMAGAASSNSNPSGVQGVCPIGWHLPSDAEWLQLTDFLGGEGVAGGKMKETSSPPWASPNTGATNESGFSGLPGGYRSGTTPASFLRLNTYAMFWSTLEVISSDSKGRGLYNLDATVYNYDYYKYHGFSVRCIKSN